MSWSELERLVESAESEPELRRALGHCRSRQELLWACQRLGFAIELKDLQLARRLELQNERQLDGAPGQRRHATPPLDRCG